MSADPETKLDKGSSLPDAVASHRGRKILNLAVTCGLLWWIGGCVLGFAGYIWNGTIQSILPFLGCGLPVVVTGQFCGVVAVVFAYRDLRGMKMGRVDRAGWWPTVIGGSMAIFFLLQYWVATGLALRDLL